MLKTIWVKHFRRRAVERTRHLKLFRIDKIIGVIPFERKTHKRNQLHLKIIGGICQNEELKERLHSIFGSYLCICETQQQMDEKL